MANILMCLNIAYVSNTILSQMHHLKMGSRCGERHWRCQGFSCNTKTTPSTEGCGAFKSLNLSDAKSNMDEGVWALSRLQICCSCCWWFRHQAAVTPSYEQIKNVATLCLPVKYLDSWGGPRTEFDEGCALVIESPRCALEQLLCASPDFYDLPRTHRLPEMFVRPLCRRDVMRSTCERKERGDGGWNRGRQQHENGGEHWKLGWELYSWVVGLAVIWQ